MSAPEKKLPLFVRYWKKDRDIFLPPLLKVLFSFVFVGGASLLTYYVFSTEQADLLRHRTDLQVSQQTLWELRENQTMHARNKNKINTIHTKNFFVPLKEPDVTKVWNGLIQIIQYPAKEDYEITGMKRIVSLEKHPAYSLITAELKMHAMYWHENDVMAFWERMDELPGVIRERECQLTRNQRELPRMDEVEQPAMWAPALEAKCVLGLFWVQS